MPGYLYVLIGVAAVVGLALTIHRFGWSYVMRRFRLRLRTGFRGKTLWDWLQLLVVPLALALIAVGFNLVQDSREAARKQRELHIAARARAQDARLAEDARRDAAVTAYLQRMSELTLQHRLMSDPPYEVKVLAQTLTLSALRRLDGRRKGQVVRFLADAGLIRGDDPPVRLAGTDLRDLDMSYAVVKATFREIVGDPDRGPDIPAHPRPMRGTLLDLSASDLRNADFTGATVAEVDLQGADLRGAHFDGANLVGFDLRSACLTNTHFRGATIIGAMLGGAIGDHIDFTNAALGNISLDPFAEDPTAARLTNLKLDGLRVLKPGDFPALTTREYTGPAAQTMRRKIRATLEAKPDGLPSTRKALDRQCDASRALKALSP